MLSNSCWVAAFCCMCHCPTTWEQSPGETPIGDAHWSAEADDRVTPVLYPRSPLLIQWHFTIPALHGTSGHPTIPAGPLSTHCRGIGQE